MTLDSIVVASKSVVSCDLEGEAAMLNMDDGVYYGLNEVGATIWNLIQEPRKVSEVLKKLLEEYEVEEDECEEDLSILLNKLLDNDLIVIQE